MAPRTPVLRRRTERAQAEGWHSYGQKRRWQPRLADLDTVQRLSEEWGPFSPEQTPRPAWEATGSILAERCNSAVNPHDAQPGELVGTWQARLVVKTLARRRRRVAARKGWRTRRRAGR